MIYIKQKNKFNILIPIILIITIFLIYINFFGLNSIVFHLQSSFSIKLKRPDKELMVVNNRGGLHGDGEAFYVLDYNSLSDKDIKSLLNWNKKNNVISRMVDEFFASIQQTSKSSNSLILKEYQEQIGESLEYFLVTKNDNRDYVILLLDINKKQIFVLIYHS